ncbi:hypothetical protein [Candidatus Finniella inopinata]|uniref:Uncharacterized protein n=1 Tax=Candidatus Finniella inopinata TaxID=1696036 RepID=A0A4Q7DJI0_9PROT|nr:hypothetical protein [Candidatus Finniella inopinata]RZI46194.1 hypothetical protein EQU50_04460 [Candidatus Finniella inopinata]
MRFGLFLLGVSLSALTCAYGADVVDLQNFMLSETGSSSHALPLKESSTALMIFQVPLKDPSTQKFLTKYGQGLLVRYGSPGTGGNFFSGGVTNLPLDCNKVSDPSEAPWLKTITLDNGKYAWQLWVTKEYKGTDIATDKANKGWIAQGHITLNGLSTSYQITPGEKNT